MRRSAAFVVLAVALTACDGDTGVMLGLASAPVKPAATFDIVCDAGGGGNCTADTLDRTLVAMLPPAAARPGSPVRLWMVGNSLDDTRVVATAEAPLLSASRQRAGHTTAQFTATTRESFLAAFRAAAPERRSRSPLAMALSRLAFTRAGTRERLVVVLSDGREYSDLGDWECGPVPDVPEFRSMLSRNRLLTSKSLADVNVAFVVGFTALDGNRCPITMPRADQIRTLWISTLTAAGARHVTYAETVVLPDHWR